MVQLFIDFHCSQTHRGRASVGKPLNPLYQPLLDSCLLGNDGIMSIYEVSGDSPNSTGYSTWDWSLFKLSVLYFYRHFYRLNQIATKKDIISLFSAPGKLKLPRGKKLFFSAPNYL